jgi:hypothetical protein
MNCCFLSKREAPLKAELSQLPVNEQTAEVRTSLNLSDFAGGFNGSTQHLGRTQLALKTKAKSLAQIKTARALPWLGFERVEPNGWILPGKHCRTSAIDGVASTV